MNRFKKISSVVIGVLFIISFAICFTVFFKPLYYFDVDYLKIDQMVGMSKEVIKHNYDILIQYQSMFYSGELSFPNFVMSTHGKIHFEEVKQIFVLLQIVCIVSGIITIPLIYKKYKEEDFVYFKSLGLTSIILPLVIGGLASIDFNQAFITFHHIAFSNDYWIFDERLDPIITVLPEAFFMHCFMMIVFIVVLLSIIMLFVSKRLLKRVSLEIES